MRQRPPLVGGFFLGLARTGAVAPHLVAPSPIPRNGSIIRLVFLSLATVLYRVSVIIGFLIRIVFATVGGLSRHVAWIRGTAPPPLNRPQG